jgi:hypothetical protein
MRHYQAIRLLPSPSDKFKKIYEKNYSPFGFFLQKYTLVAIPCSDKLMAVLFFANRPHTYGYHKHLQISFDLSAHPSPLNKYFFGTDFLLYVVYN